MTDTRVRVPLTKRIDLAQLAAEVGADLTASDVEVVVADEDSTVTQSALQTAIDAHTPAAAPDPDAEFRTALQGATSWQTLRDALLGNVGPGAQPRDR